jgi:hypothetical protein
MNRVAVWLIVLGIGAVFLALEFIYPYYRASIFGYSVEPLVNPDQSKARAAVSRLLFDPNSAQFNGLRAVEAQGLQYVCGDVDAKDRSGSYSGPREFVYEVKRDNARIDDSEQIARIHDAYKPCPENIEPSMPQPMDLETAIKVVRILKVIPKPGLDPQTLASLGSLLATKPSTTAAAEKDLQTGLSQFRSSGGGGPGAKDLESGLGRFRTVNTLAQAAASDGAATQPNAKPSQADVPFTADLKNEREWRGDHPPVGWPAFPSDDPLARPVRKRTPEQAIALASGVEARWKSFKAGRSASHPRTGEIEEALRALLAIEPNSREFPKAWALFVSLRQIDREAGAMESRPKPAAKAAR